MAQSANTAKALLSKQQHLLGFVNCGGEHLVRRASSAKIFVVEPGPITDPAKVSAVATPRPARKTT
jgi:hypothetical protein